MDAQQRVFKLNGVVQNYSWGGFNYLPGLIGIVNEEEKPFAEYWLGAHPNHPAMVQNREINSLAEVLKAEPNFLGTTVVKKFAALPYLLKVLDVRQMLSIQVHPSKASAKEGYSRENAAGLALTAYNRNYKDPNHKPELMVALGDFWLLHGFKPEAELVRALEQRPPLSFLIAVFQKQGYQGLYRKVMELDQEEVNRILRPLIDSILPLYQQDVLQPSSEDFWAARAAQTFCTEDQLDRGIFSIYFFNLLHLKKGEGIYQPAGLPHAYLEGQNVEIMSNSDNVLRAGLTSKHVDVPELLSQVIFEPTYPQIIPASKASHQVYHSPAEEFELHSYRLEKGLEKNIRARTAEILLVTEGAVAIGSGEETAEGKKGQAFLLMADSGIMLKGLKNAEVFRATVPVDKNSES